MNFQRLARTKIASCGVLCVCTFLLVPLPHAANKAAAQARFWLSPLSLPLGSAPPNAAGEIPELSVPLVAADHAIQVWGRPEAGKTLTNFSLNVVANAPDIVRFTGVTLFNELASDGQTRFEFSFDTATGLNLAAQTPCILGPDDPADEAIWGLKGFTLELPHARGIGPTSNADDPFYDASHDAWLLATVNYEAISLGSVDLFLQIGEIGVNHIGEDTEATSIRLGAATDPLLNAKLDRCRDSLTPETRLTVIEPLLGDFNFNNQLDANDIDLLSAEVIAVTHSALFELSGDSFVDQTDRQVWVETVSGTYFGDADLNRRVDFTDFVALANHFLLPGGWAEGDFDGDAFVDFSDFVLLAGTFGNSSAAAISTVVPEPHLFPPSIALMTCVTMFATRRRLKVFE